MATTTDAVVTRLFAALEPADGGGPASSSQAFTSLKRWNDDVEAGFGVPPAPAQQRRTTPGNDEHGGGSGCDSDPPPASISGAAEALHSRLVGCVASEPPLFAGISSPRDDDGRSASATEGEAIGAAAVACCAGSFSPGDSASDVDADLSASRAARAVQTSSPPTADVGTSTRDGGGDTNSDDGDTVKLASELLRSIKNLIRHRNQTRLIAGAGRRMRSTRADGAEGNDDDDDDPLRRLRSPGTLRLYLTLVDCCSSHFRQQGGRVGGGGAVLLTDDVARNASLALFHATYGDPTENVPASRARVALVEEVDVVPKLMELLAEREEHPTPLLLSLVRHVHCLVASSDCPKIVERMDGALVDLESASKEDEEGKAKSKDLLSVLVSKLAWSVRSEPPFPGTDGGDRRADVACEILRILFALRATGAVPSPDCAPDGDGSENETMTQLGVLLCDLLRVPNADMRAYVCKLAAVNLLMDSPPGYARYLLVNGAIRPLLTVLRLQLDEVVVVKTGSGNADAAALVPILAVLERLSAEDGEVLRMVKDGIFPPDAEESFEAKAKVETDKMGGGSGAGIRAKNMHPLDAPPGTARWKLIRLMTWIESNVKRCSSELLWTVCGGDATELVLRTGYGNSVHILGIKGLVSIPKDSSVKF